MEIKQHQTLADRLSAAQKLVDLEPRCPVVVDHMSNVTASKYGALPERLYVLQAGKVVYKVKIQVDKGCVAALVTVLNWFNSLFAHICLVTRGLSCL